MGQMRIAAGGFAILVVSLQSIAAGAADTKLFTTNGVRAVLNQIGPQFQRETGNVLDIQYGAGPVLKRQIEAGEAFDVAILPLDIGDLISQGKIIADTRVVLGRTGYGAAVRMGAPRPDISTADSLKRALLNAKLVAYAAEGVSGTYFLNLLKRLGIAAEMQSKIKPATAAAGSMAALVSGEADIAIGGIAVILSAPSVELAGWLPSDLQSHVVFTAGVSASTSDIKASKALVNMLTTPAAVTLFKSAGIEPASP